MADPPAVSTDKTGEVLVNVADRPGYSPEFAGCFPHSAATACTMQYFSEFMPPGSRNDPERLQRLVRKFFVPDVTVRIQLLNSVTHLAKTFDFPYSGVPYFIDMCARNNHLSMRALFGETDEYRCDPNLPPPPPPPSYKTRIHEPIITGNVTHVVESQQMMQLSTMDNGWQIQRIGMFRALLTPYTTVEEAPVRSAIASNANAKILQLETRLRLRFFCFSTLAQVVYIPTNSLRYGIDSVIIPAQIVKEIMNYGVEQHKKRTYDPSAEDSEPNKSPKKVRTLTPESSTEASGATANKDVPNEDMRVFTLPPVVRSSPVIENWMTNTELPYLLDIIDSVHRLQDLIEIQIQEGRGPSEVLQRYHEQRVQESHDDSSGLAHDTLMNIPPPHLLFD
ncbi:hypothetical protein MYAM1_002448 [Malassezia yamatoensis]|uniref:Uncharacterized protein n=1 Tax=Malassezia yamatoensis TaxID=253288 RepID=A0AAJ6CIB8_9BASI|nr:hypothetical protein MYAM1_002448 [Malassezia yamatoensis]